MKKKALKLLLMTSRYVLIGFLIQFLSFSLLFGNDAHAQLGKIIHADLNGKSVTDIFRIIEGETDFRFVYDSDKLDTFQKLNMPTRQNTVKDIFDKMRQVFSFDFQIINNTVTVVQYFIRPVESIGELEYPGKAIEVPQELTSGVQLSILGMQNSVGGRVTDALSGEPLPGVSVIVKNSQNGTSTDLDGQYRLENVPEGSILVFTYLGYLPQEINFESRTTVNVEMAIDQQKLEEVVVVGYGIQKRSDLTGAVASADMEIFEESPNVNILESLHGSVPGLNVGAVRSSGENPSISIRGQNNFAGESAPLVVLDGIIYRGNLNDINPNDVKSIDILKDASAASVYGSEAANGVILISTKKGNALDKPVINYSASYSLQEPSNRVRPENAAGNIRSIIDSYWQLSYLGPDYTQPNPDFDPTVFFKTPDYVTGYRQFMENGKETDWWNLLTGNAYIQDHYLSVRGQGKSVNYYFSGGLTDQDGVIDNDDYKRYSVRVNLSSKIKDWLDVGINSFATKSDYSGLNVDQNELFEYHPLLSPFDEDGELILRPDGLRLNPFHISQVSDRDEQSSLFATFYSDIKLPFFKGFNYRLNWGNDYRRNQHYQFDPWASDELGEGFKNYGNYYNLTLDNIFSYENLFRDRHKLNITFVYGVEKREGETTNTFARDFNNKQLGYNALQQGNAAQYILESDAWKETSLYTMGRVSYAYMDKYLFTGTVRRDGFSGFGEDNKIGVFPSVSFGWVLSEESFIKDRLSWVSHLKLRGSYGTTARRSLNRYQTLAKVTSEYNYVFGEGGSPVLGQWLSSLASPGLKWETTTGINIGMDFALFNSRFGGNIEYYDSDTKDILYGVSLPRMTGFSSISTNIGKVHNHGLEFSLHGALINNKNMYWDATVNYSMNRNRIVSIIGADFDGDGREDDLISDGLFIGEPIGVIYGYENIGMWQLADEEAGIIPEGFRPGTYKVKDLDGDGIITAEGDRRILGYTQPAYRFSIATSLKYKRFTFRVFLNSAQGGRNFYYSASNDPGGGSGDNWDNRNKPQLWDYWLPGNPDAYYRRLDLTSSHHQPRLAQRNFVRLQDASIAYEFDADLLQKLKVQRLKVYISGKNLVTWAGQWDGWDPETGQGYTSEGTPVLRNYSIGLNVEF